MWVVFSVKQNRSAQQHSLPIARIEKIQAKMAACNDRACARDLIQEDGNNGLTGEAQGRSKSQRASVDTLARQKARTARR